MGQTFNLYNFDNSVIVPSNTGAKFGEFFFGPMEGIHLLSALWSPNENEKRVLVLPLDEVSCPQESNENYSKGLMNRFSNEVVSVIIRKILDISDLISLMVTCQRYWELGRHHLQRLLEDSIVSWAGDRLICLGDCADIDDLPKGMLTDSEVERLSLLYDKSYETVHDAILRFPNPTPRSSRPMHSTVNAKAAFIFDLYLRLEESRGMRWLWSNKIYGRLERLILITDPDPAEFCEYMVLRNLTTKEYVRGDAITEAWDMPDKPWLKSFGFEHVLYIRTTWSSNPSLSCLYEGPLQIHRGVWAGHRFDVTCIESVEDEEGVAVDSWKDVTKEVLNEVIEIWEREGRYEFNL